MNGEILNINNIGKIKTASVRLDGLSIITGKNDTGKSTIGKVIFSIVKAISRYKEDFQNYKEQEIFELIEKLYFKIRNTSKTSNDIRKIRELFYPPRFFDEIKQLVDNQSYDIINVDYRIIKNEVEIYLEPRINFIKSYFEKNQIKELINILEEIKRRLLINDDETVQIINALNKAFVSEFHFELTPKHSSKNKSIISYDSASRILEVVINKNKINSIFLSDELLFKDVTYIESPIYLQLSNLIDNADTLFDFDIEEERKLIRRRPKTSLHIKDLINKLEQSKYFSETFVDVNLSLLKRISKIMNGSYLYDEKKSEFKFKKGNTTIKAINTASGIKSFGIIQLLLQANAINERTLLIIDEPENHLHPEWQIKYADIITELIKDNISVIINSHSPYMIQALNHFSLKKEITDKTNFYLSEQISNSNMVKFINVTDNTDIIFRTLAEPLNNIMW